MDCPPNGWRHTDGVLMAGNASTPILSLVLLAACTAFGQQSRPLPDAPSPLTACQPLTFRSLMDTQSLPVNKLATPGEGAMHHVPGHFEIESANRVSADDAARSSFLAKRYAIYHGSTSDTVLGRMSDAASSIVLTRDEQGNRRLNTTYLLRVVTASVAHSAYRPYGRRSAAQPISDFGSTVGSDAGMNVLHEFEPGIRQLVKSHEPRFVSRIGEHLSHK